MAFCVLRNLYSISFDEGTWQSHNQNRVKSLNSTTPLLEEVTILVSKNGNTVMPILE